MAAPGKPLQNILWLVGERVVRATVTATVLGLVARQLAPAGFGRLNLAIAMSAIAAALANLGLEGLVVNELVHRPGQEGAVLGTALRLRAVAGGVAAALLAIVAWLTPGLRSDLPLIMLVAFSLVCQPAEVVDLWFQRHLASRRTVAVRFGVVLAGAALKFWLVAQDAPVVAFAGAQAIEAALFAAGLGWAYRVSPVRAGPWRWDGEIARILWRRGWPLAVSGVVVVFALRLDQLLVRAWLGAGESGVYFAAARLTELVLFTGTAMTLSFFPGLAASRTQSGEAFNGRLQAMFDALSALGWVAALGFTLLGAGIIRGLYGPDYHGAVVVLALQGWACLFALSAGVRWQFILLAAPTELNLVAAACSIATQFTLSWYLVPQYGAPGAAGAWLAGAVVSGFLTSFALPALRPCAAAQTRGLLIPFAPGRWRAMLKLFST